MHQPLFVSTTRGYINLALVQLIKPPERGLVRFVFGERDFVDIPEDEARGVERAIAGMLVWAD